MSKVLAIIFLVLAPILMITGNDMLDSGDTWTRPEVTLTVILLVATGSYYAWVKPKSRSKWWMLPAVLVIGFMLPAGFAVLITVTEPTTDDFSIAIEKLAEAEEMLRKRDSEGLGFTLGCYAIVYERIAKEVGKGHPDGYFNIWADRFVTEDMGFSPLAVFYKESRELMQRYISLRKHYEYDTYVLDALRQKYEKGIPELDAVLFLWGKEPRLETRKAVDIVVAMSRHYGITKTMVSSFEQRSGRELWERIFLPSLEEFEKLIEDFEWRERFGY